MAFVGYHMGLDNEGQPIAAATTYNEAFSKTLARVTAIYNGDLMGLMASQMAVHERELTDEQVAEFERIALEVLSRPPN